METGVSSTFSQKYSTGHLLRQWHPIYRQTFSFLTCYCQMIHIKPIFDLPHACYMCLQSRYSWCFVIIMGWNFHFYYCN